MGAYTREVLQFQERPYLSPTLMTGILLRTFHTYLNHINEMPAFDPIGPICQNSSAPMLPSVSLNGYSGTWSGAIDSSITGIQTFTFTPDANQCSFTAQIEC